MISKARGKINLSLTGILRKTQGNDCFLVKMKTKRWKYLQKQIGLDPS